MEDREKEFPNSEHELHSHKPEVDPDVDLKTLTKILVLSLFVFQAMFLLVPIYLLELEKNPDIAPLVIAVLFSLFDCASQCGYYLGFRPTIVIGFSSMSLWSILAWVCELFDLTFLRKWAIVTVWMWLFVCMGAFHMLFYYFKKLRVMRLIGICLLGAIFSVFSNFYIRTTSSYNVILAAYFVYCLLMAGLFYWKAPNTPRLYGEVSFKTMRPRIAGFGLIVLLNFIMLNILAVTGFNGVFVMAFAVYLGLSLYPYSGLIHYGHPNFFRSDLRERGRRNYREIHETFFPFLASSEA
ncbi:hypothetical protein C7M61_003281 [Candidozyma pseudohaemuli]|uniref:Uncharacterized protein n=1 Tax=Candidozyma pseudohaemuli TaxID=418784 RepID=A0A2P7YNP3_9ASCO|nr:hypothetical protein C7M61_003281 [[Candida] pseudohaemulonii]PSK37575.1 hypothetical protein C7M61_003281 [[Candida] pseudohaemulonii]